MSPLETTIQIDGLWNTYKLQKIIPIFFSTEIWSKFYPNTLKTINIKGSGLNINDEILEKYRDNTGYYVFHFTVIDIQITKNRAFIEWFGICIEPNLDSKKFNCSIKYKFNLENQNLYFTRSISLKSQENNFIDFNTLVNSHYIFLEYVKKYTQFILNL